MRILMVMAIICAGGCLRTVDLDGDGIDAAVDAPQDSASDLDCAIPLDCPAPSAGQVTLCGRILDAETDAEVAAETATRQACTSVTAAGPCSLRVRYFDALDYAMNPSGAMPLSPQASIVDDCGRFRATNLPRAVFGFISVVIDDDPSVIPAQAHAPTAVTFSNEVGSVPADVRAYATRGSTVELWSTSAGLTGPSFVARGAALLVFRHAGAPRAAVALRRNGELSPVDDFYFSDTGPSRTTIDTSLTATGPNGSVLVTGSSSPLGHDGVGGEPSGCVWPNRLVATIPGAFSIHIVEAETPAGAACP